MIADASPLRRARNQLPQRLKHLRRQARQSDREPVFANHVGMHRSIGAVARSGGHDMPLPATGDGPLASADRLDLKTQRPGETRGVN